MKSYLILLNLITGGKGTEMPKTALQKLNNLAKQRMIEKYPFTPRYALSIKKYKLTTANGLTRAVIDYINFSGGQAERISVTGRLVDNRKEVTNVIGQRRLIGTKKYLKSSMQVGTADISATIPDKNGVGLSVKIEIKIGSDKQSEKQKQYQESIEKAGGIYLIIRDLEQFVYWFECGR